jgi:predicted Zn-dependent protease
VAIPTAGSVYLYFHYLEEVPLTHRKRWIATSSQWERQLGDQEYKALLQQYQKDILPNDHRASITVRRVGNRIAQAAQEFAQQQSNSAPTNSHFSNPPTFTVVRSEMANAFVLPNNHIFVMTGLFQFARDEDDLAAVLGHEMAHNLARHVGEKVSGNTVVGLLARLSLLVDPSGLLMSVFLPTANLLRELPHSRIHELEADQIGMHLAAMACYDPQAAKRVFQRMKESARNQPPEFLSTHPSHDSRIQKMDDWLPETRRIFHQSGRCEVIREEMVAARHIAAQRAVQREQIEQRENPSQ